MAGMGGGQMDILAQIQLQQQQLQQQQLEQQQQQQLQLQQQAMMGQGGYGGYGQDFGGHLIGGAGGGDMYAENGILGPWSASAGLLNKMGPQGGGFGGMGMPTSSLAALSGVPGAGGLGGLGGAAGMGLGGASGMGMGGLAGLRQVAARNKFLRYDPTALLTYCALLILIAVEGRDLARPESRGLLKP
jgi:hypothetical protein